MASVDAVDPVSKVLLLPEYIDMIIDEDRGDSLRAMQAVWRPWHDHVLKHRQGHPSIQVLSFNLTMGFFQVGLNIEGPVHLRAKFHRNMPHECEGIVTQNATSTMYRWRLQADDPTIDLLIRRIFNNTNHVYSLILSQLDQRWFRRVREHMTHIFVDKIRVTNPDYFSKQSRMLAEVILRKEVVHFELIDKEIENCHDMRDFLMSICERREENKRFSVHVDLTEDGFVNAQETFWRRVAGEITYHSNSIRLTNKGTVVIDLDPYSEFLQLFEDNLFDDKVPQMGN